MSNFDNSVPPLPGEDWEKFMEYQRGEHDPNPANMNTLNTPNTPYRLAHQIQEAILQLAEVNDYTMGLAERQDLATDIANDWFNRQTFEPADLAFEGLNQWRRIWGRE